MRNLFATLALAATTAFTALPAAAAVLDIPGATASFVLAPSGDVGDFTFDDAAGLLDGTTDVVVSFALNFETANPYGTADASLDISDTLGELLFSNVLSSIGYEKDLLKLVFAGSGSGLFADGLSLDLFFLDPAVGSNPLTALSDGGSYEVAALGQNVAAVPLPGSLPLLAGALGFMALRRRKAQQA